MLLESVMTPMSLSEGWSFPSRALSCHLTLDMNPPSVCQKVNIDSVVLVSRYNEQLQKSALILNRLCSKLFFVFVTHSPYPLLKISLEDLPRSAYAGGTAMFARQKETRRHFRPSL